MNAVTPLDLGRDVNIIKLAREVGIDHYPIADILARYNISEAEWEALQEYPRFQELVEIERQNWNSALNTNGRIKLKSATLIEEWMEEGHRLLHASGESMNSKVELIKLLGKFSGLDTPAQMQGEMAGRVTINIKIGDTVHAFDGVDGNMIEAEAYNEGDADTIEYDWDEEFEADPTEDAMTVFDAAE
jgi:hypothetical protein